MFIWGNTLLYLGLHTTAELYKFLCFVLGYNQLNMETSFSFEACFSY